MKKQILFLIALIFLINIISLVMASDIRNYCYLEASIVNQDPNPAVPGEYVKIIFQLAGVNNSKCNGAKFGLIPEYPFSLDNNDTTRILESYIYAPGYKEVWTIPYKIRVDKNAVSGEYELKVRYSEGHSKDWNVYTIKTFNIAIEDSKTSFDAVIQEISGSEVSIAIANIGKNIANSVIVRIPEQDNFKVIGTSGQMVGNLDAGDYTIITFTIIPNMMKSIETTPQTTPPNTSQNKLKVRIDYTDKIGERRTSILEIPFPTVPSMNLTATENFRAGFQRRQKSNVFSKWYFWTILGVILLIGFGFYNKYKKRIKNSFSKIKEKLKNPDKEKISEEPEWIKKEKAKLKKQSS